ncbi:MAG: ABC transporter ATP-binding protein [Bacillota bacterium]
MAEAILELKDIEKVYGTRIKTKVLHGVSLKFEPNSFNAIIGQSGSGKSTLLNIMGTLDNPTSGSVTIKGMTTNAMKKKALANLRNETIGFVFQYHYLLPEFTAKENILMPYRIRKAKVPKEVEAYADELMEVVGITEVAHNPAFEMSGGQQQRTAIARALLNKPSIVLADEPTGSLDSRTTDKVYDLLRTINRTYGTTFIVITHDRRVAEKADRIIQLEDGNIEMDMTTQQGGISDESARHQ